MQEMLFQRPNFLEFPGAHAPRHPWLTRACGSRLTPSAIANYPGGGGRTRKMGPLAVFPTTEESLKMHCATPKIDNMFIFINVSAIFQSSSG